MRQLSHKETVRRAKESTDSLDRLIDPSDIDETAECWDDIDPNTLGREMHKCETVMISEGQSPYKGLLRDRALTIWQENMPRLAMKHLAASDAKTAVLEVGVWPNHVDKFQCREWLEENPHVITADVRAEARAAVSKGIRNGLRP